MRKILSIVLVLALVLSSAGMAFAAPSSVSADVEDKTVKAAVERLVAFGIVNGMDDGKYHPEKEVTREQFAKILVTALGMESAAGAVSSTSFTDVASDRWSAGYIEVAAGQGLIKGYPDGTFQPTKGVSYAEAVTMLVRALGYSDEFVKGTWPANYIAKASAEGITKKVNFSASSKVADRGSVAVMVNNTLDADVIDVKEYGGDTTPTYEKTGETLLENKLEIYDLENVRFIENAKLDKGLDSTEVRVIFTKDTDFKGTKDVYDKDEKVKFEIVKGFDSDYFLGLDTTVYLNDDDEIVYAEVSETGNTVYRNERLDYSYTEKPYGEITLYNAGVDLEVPDTASIYVDGEKIDDDDFDDYIGDTDTGWNVFGTFIADDDELVYANLVTWEKANYMVQEVDEDDDTIVYLDTKTASDDKKLDLADNYDSYKIYIVEGEDLVNAEISDLEAGDIFNVAEVEEDGDDVASVYVWRNSVEGKMGKITGANNDERMAIKVGDDKISVETNFTYSDDNGDDFTSGKGRYDGAVATKKKLEDFYGEEIKVYKNWKNRIVYLDGDVNTTSDELYGVVLGYGSGLNEEVKLYTKDDDDIIYDFEESDDFDYLKEEAPVGSIIKYELNKDGDIAEYGKYDDVIFKVSDTATIKDGNDFGSKSVKIGSKTYYVTDDTIFFDYTEHDEEEVEVFDWSSIKGKDVEEDVTVIFAADGTDLEFLAIYDNLDDIRDDVMVGYVLDTGDIDGDYYAEVAVYGEDEVKEYEIDSGLARDVEDGDILLDGRVWLFETTSGGKFNIIEPAEEKDWEIVAGMITDIDGDKITIEDEDYVVDDDALIYQGSSESSFSKIDEDDFVVLAVEKGEVKAIELVYAKSSGDRYGEGEIVSINPFKVDGFDQKFTDDIADALLGNGYIIYDNDLDDYAVGDTIKFLYEEDRDEIQVIWAETTGDNPVDEDVVAVEEAIEALPDADDITEDDEDDVVAAREAFDDLTSAQQDEVDADLVDKLEECEAKIEELKNNQGGDEVTGSVEKAANNPIFGMTTITVTLDGTDTPEDYTVTIDGTEIPFKSTVHKLTVASSDDLAKMTEAELEDALVIEEK